MPHDVTPDPLSPSVANPDFQYDGDAPLVRINALRGALDVSGLSEDETNLVLEAWSRCDARVITAAEAAAIPANQVLRRDDADSWNVFHEHLVYKATSTAIISGKGDLLMFHGAALKDPDSSKTFVLVAESGGGKTTATRELGKSFEYLTDETVGVDTELSISQFPKPLSVLEGDMVRPKVQYGPDSLGLLEPTGPASLSVICLLHRDKSGESTGASAERIPTTEAIALIAPQTSSLSRLDRGLVRLCEAIDSTGGVLRLHYSEARDLSRLMSDVLHSHPSKCPAAKSTEMTPDDRWVPAENLRPLDNPRFTPIRDEYMRLNVDDAIYFNDGSLCLLVGEKFTALRGVGPFIWEMLETPLVFEDLAEEARGIDGSPENVEQILREALDSMIANEIITRGDLIEAK